MPLTRKIRSLRGRTVLEIPSQLIEAYDLSEGDELEIIPLGRGEIKIKKAKIPRSHGDTR